MDGKLETTMLQGIERNTQDERTNQGSMQELINLRFKDGAWRNANRKAYLGQISSPQQLIGWSSHPALKDTQFVCFSPQTNIIVVVDYEDASITPIYKRNGDLFVLPVTESFVGFSNLENVLILRSDNDMYRFLWINGKFEYVEFGDIEWTVTKSSVYNTRLESETIEGVIADYQKLRSDRRKLGYIDGASAFRLAIELFDGSFVLYTDIRMLLGTSKIDFPNLSVGNNPTFSQSTCYRPIIYEDTNAPLPDKPFILSEYTDYHPIINYTIPEWLTYYIELGLIRALHVCSIKPRFPYIPVATEWDYMTIINGFKYYHIKPSALASDLSNVLFLDETDKFYSIFKTSLGVIRVPSPTEAFDFLDFETKTAIPTDNFTFNRTTSKYSFNYNQRLHLQQITTTLPSPYILDNDYYKDLKWGNVIKAKSFKITPPPIGERVVGDAYVVYWDGGQLSGEWFGRQNQIAVWQGSFWSFTVPDYNDYVLVLDNSTYDVVSPFSPRNSYYVGKYQWANGGGFPDHWKWIGLSGLETPSETALTDYVVTADYDMYIDAVISANNNKYVVRTKTNLTYKQVKNMTDAIYCGRFTHFPNVSIVEIRMSFSKDNQNFYKLKNPIYRISMRPVSSLNIGQSILTIDEDVNFKQAKLSELINYDYFNTGYEFAESLFIKLSVPPAGTDYATSPLCELVTDDVGKYIDTNRVQLSELSNPFLFPAINSYRFGDINNEVVGVEVPREQLTETRFGQFPLYIFTSQGIWVMEQGQAPIVYASSYYLDKYICTEHDLIKSVQGLVIFATAEGIYAVAGRSFQELSTKIEGSIAQLIPAEILDIIKTKFIEDENLYLSMSQIDLPQVILQSIVCYDFIQKELHFCPSKLNTFTSPTPDLNYTYLYNITNKNWSKVSESFYAYVDFNPNVVGIKYRLNSTGGEKPVLSFDYSFFDMHNEVVKNDAKVMITRPVTFGSMIYKRIEQTLLRYMIMNTTVVNNEVYKDSIYFWIFGSIDGREYKLLQGGEINTSYMNDMSLRRVFVDCKYFVFAFVCNHEFVELLQIDNVVKPKFTKTLR